MLKRFFPTKHYDTVFDIDYKALYEEGYRGLLFDIDNTLVPYDTLDADEKIIRFFKELQAIGFEMCLVSNNNKERVYRFNKKIKVHAIYNTLKPLRRKLRKGMAFMGTDISNTVLVGDQLFTDVFGGNRLGIMTLLVTPIQDKEQWITKIKRSTEKKVFDIYLKSLDKKGKNNVRS